MGLGHARTYLKGYLMAIEKTFIMIKPDAVRDRKIGEIVARIERSGLVIERMEMTTLERATPLSPRCAPLWALPTRLMLPPAPFVATSLSMSTPT